MPPETWQGVEYDCILVCVDRFSGWIIAKPTQKLGLTAGKAAHVLLDDGWDIYGIPTTITSDQGPQFVGVWWKTMCSRLGIRHAYSQAHRPQSNGRAEVAGHQIISLLRKMNADGDINWVEALPRALRIHHDTIGPSGLSPYQIVFGRERNLPGLPTRMDKKCEDALDFMARMSRLDFDISKAMNELHERQKDKVNQRKGERPPFKVGDKVWVMRPKPLGGHKIQPWWAGPYPIVQRMGTRSYGVEWAPG